MDRKKTVKHLIRTYSVEIDSVGHVNVHSLPDVIVTIENGYSARILEKLKSLIGEETPEYKLIKQIVKGEAWSIK